MKTSPEGLVPARGFLEAGMSPRPSFNDGSKQGEKELFNYLYLGNIWEYIPCVVI